jgi:hypothetical protein
MFSWSVLGSLLLRGLILFRGYRSRTLWIYGWFYAYITSTVLADILINVARVHYLSAYKPVYWACQFTTLAIGCSIVLEIFRHVLEPYPGAERFARIFCLVTFGIVFLAGFLFPLSDSGQLQAASIELERDVRCAQAVFLVVIVAVISYYVIPLGKNMRGMMVGYGIYLGVSLITLAVRAYKGMDFDRIWRVLQPLSFDISLVIWLSALWAFHPNPVPKWEVRIESDYEALAAETKRQLKKLLSYLGGPTR